MIANLPEPEAVSTGQKALTSPSPQSPSIKSINQGSNGPFVGLSCHVYKGVFDDWPSLYSPPSLPSLANEDNDPAFSETRPAAQPKPHSRNAARNLIRERVETHSGGSIAAGAKEKRHYLEDTTNGPGTKSREPKHLAAEYSRCEPYGAIVVIHGLGGSRYTTWASKMLQSWPSLLFSETVRQTYPRNHSTYDIAERSSKSTPANIQRIQRFCGQTVATHTDVYSSKQCPQSEDLPIHESGNPQTHRVDCGLMLDNSLFLEQVIEPALTDPWLGSELAVLDESSSLLSSLFLNGPYSADHRPMGSLYPSVQYCFPHTGVNFDLASHKHSEADHPRTAHQADDAHHLVIHGFDRMKPLQRCSHCERDLTNRYVLKSAFKRHLEDQHFPQLEYLCHYMCHYVCCRHDVKTHIHSDHHKSPFSRGDPCSARSLCRHQQSGVVRYRQLPPSAERVSRSTRVVLFSETKASTLHLEQLWTTSCSNGRRRPSPCPGFLDCLDDYILRPQHIDWTAVASPSRPAQLRFLFNGASNTCFFVHSGIQLNSNHQGIQSSHIVTLTNDEESQARTHKSDDLSAAVQHSGSVYVNKFPGLAHQTSSLSTMRCRSCLFERAEKRII